MTKACRPALFVFILCWASLSFLSSPSLYWRDSGELIVSAVGLDIAHPPGYPTYAIFGNLFSLIPIGPLAWRINLLSSFAASLLLALGFSLGFSFLSNRGLSYWKSLALSLLLISVLFGAPAFLRQALSAEAYMLNSLVFLLLIMLLFKWAKERDVRYLFSAAFISGLGIGVHVSIALVCVAVTPYLIWGGINAKAHIKKLLIFGAVGLLVFTYLPIRASVDPWLNYGDPDSLSRFAAHVSDKRDRDLPKSSVIEGSLSGADLARSLGEISRTILSKMESELGWPVVILSIVGIFWLRRKLGLEYQALILALFAYFLFFFSWDTDPWIPVLLFLSLAATIVVGVFVLYLCQSKRGLQVLSWPLVLLCAIFPFSRLSVAHQNAARDLYLPRDFAVGLVADLPYRSAVLTEGSSFLLWYLKYVERFRDDLGVIYPLKISYPEYFGDLQIRGSDGRLVPDFIPPTKAEPHQIKIQKLFHHLIFFSDYGPLYIEPQFSLNFDLRLVAQPDQVGWTKIIKGESAKLEEGVSDALVSMVSKRFNQVAALPEGWFKDARHHLELTTLNLADVFIQANFLEVGVRLLLSICSNASAPRCSATVLTNLSNYFIKLGQPNYAALWAISGLLNTSSSHKALRHNLGLALGQLTEGQIKEISELPGAEAVIRSVQELNSIRD